jgi:hypothetical protein
VNVRTVTVTKTSQIEKGAIYRICGNSTSRDRIPAQMFRVETEVIRSSNLGSPYVIGTHWMSLGDIGMRMMKGSTLLLEAVGVYDIGQWEIDVFEKASGVNPHDRHLERIPDHVAHAFGALEKEGRGYHEIAETPLSS